MAGAAIAAGTLAVAGPTAPAGALVDQCETTRITATTGDDGVADAALTGDGRTVIFTADHDPVGANADGSGEVFAADVVSGIVTQLTDQPAGTFAGEVATTRDGTGVAFLSDRTAPDNADGSLELFYWDRTTDVVEQITDDAIDTSFRLGLDDAGDRLAFTSLADIDGQNPGDTVEVWLHERSTGTTTPLTASDDPRLDVADVALSGDGTAVAYVSFADEVGQNADHNAEAFLLRPDSGERAQLTDTTGTAAVSEAAVDGDGDAVAVAGRADLDGTPDGGTYHLSVIDPGSGQVTQVSSIGGSESFIQEIHLDARGRRTAALTETSEAFPNAPSSIHQLDDVRTGDAAIVAQGSDGPTLALSDDGTTVAYRTTHGRAQPNPLRQTDLFVGTCPTFSDVGSPHPFWDDVEWFAAEGATQGFADGTYRPTDGVSRQAAWAFIYRLAGSPAFDPPAEPTFSDVPAEHPFHAEIEWAVAEGVTRGYPDGTFRPLAPVTRQALAAFLYRAAGEPAFALPGAPTFDDVPNDHPFATEIEWAAAAGLADGYPDGGYHPAAVVSRQAAAALLHRLVDGPGLAL